MRGAWLIFKKEALELSKDRKTLLFTFVMPLILYPVIFTMMSKMGDSDKHQRESVPSRVYLVDPGQVLKPVLEAAPKEFKLVEKPEGDLKKALRDQKLEMAVELDASATEALKAQKTFSIAATVDESDRSGELAMKRLKEALLKQNQSWVQARLQALGASKDLAEPAKVESKNAADLALELAKILGSFLPYILMITMYAGAMQHGAYITAGERERGTLLSLLATRIPRTQIIIGKMLAIFGVGLVTVLVNLTAMAWSFHRMGTEAQAAEAVKTGAPTISSALSLATPQTLGLTLALLLPLGLLFSAIILLVGTQARNTREAASALAPGIFVVVLLGMFSAAPGIEKMAFLPYVPILNVSLAIRKLFSQQPNYPQYLIALAMTVGLAGTMSFLSAKLLNRESALFKA
ncbi:MAG TPA: ABC transporter permease [Holophagaceae bacterium]|nr:ABC transporter permease [Holophagaceae bacterium]